jgi:hypothetical protein
MPGVEPAQPLEAGEVMIAGLLKTRGSLTNLRNAFNDSQGECHVLTARDLLVKPGEARRMFLAELDERMPVALLRRASLPFPTLTILAP